MANKPACARFHGYEATCLDCGIGMDEHEVPVPTERAVIRGITASEDFCGEYCKHIREVSDCEIRCHLFNNKLLARASRVGNPLRRLQICKDKEIPKP